MIDYEWNGDMEDPAMEALLYQYATTPEPDTIFVDQLERKLLAQHAQDSVAPVPSGAQRFRPLPAALRELWNTHRGRKQWLLSAISMVAAILLIVAATSLFGSWFASIRQGTDQGLAALTATSTPQLPDTSVAASTLPKDEFTPIQSGNNEFSRLAYVHNGNLWIKDVPDGEPQQLTRTGRVERPRWSPSGRWLAFYQDKFLWVMDSQAPEVSFSLQTTASSGFAWSPVADQLVFTAGNKLQLLNAVSGTITDLVSLPEDNEDMHRVVRPYWHPQGAAIAYEQIRAPFEPSDTFQGDHGIWLAKLDGSEPVQLYDSSITEKGEATLAGWTSDAKYLLFWQGPVLSASLLMDGVPLYALPVAGGGQQEPIAITVAADSEAAAPVLVHPEFIAPSPVTNEVAVTIGAGRDTWGNKEVGIASPNEGVWRSHTAPNHVTIAPAWAPQGQQLAYVTMPSNVSSAEEALRARRIEILNDGERHQLTNDPTYRDENPEWSASGSHILFARVNDQEQASLWIIPVEGGQPPQQLVEELSPAPEHSGWSSAYGYVDWGQYYDWWRPPLVDESAPDP